MGNNLAKKLQENKDPNAYQVVLFSLDKSIEKNRLNVLFSSNKIVHVVDDYVEQLHELFAVNNPALVYTPEFENLFQQFFNKQKKQFPLWQQGVWAFFPWISTLVHILSEADFQKVRTARNKNLITEKEQDKFYNCTIGIGGLSVGSSVALAIVLQGGARHLKLADFDVLALSNTNRVRAGVNHLGLPKVVIAARQIAEINPYAKVEIFSQGLTPKNIQKFFVGTPKLDLIIDELDNLAVKFLLRTYAKKYKLPVVMAADNGDNAVVDIERYDLNPKLQFFHNRLGRVNYDLLSKLNKFGIGKTITKHIGPENVTPAMQDSLLAMGKTIVSWPQLGGAALINGAAVAYVVRKILNGQKVEQNRALISLDEKLIPNYNSVPQKSKRKKIADKFKKLFGL